MSKIAYSENLQKVRMTLIASSLETFSPARTTTTMMLFLWVVSQPDPRATTSLQTTIQALIPSSPQEMRHTNHSHLPTILAPRTPALARPV